MLKMNITDKYVFFWNGPFSQWTIANMEIDGYIYNSCEQYMMHQKALTFGDEEIANLIMQELNPREQQKYGRQIKNFDKNVWDSVCLSIVYKGNLAKFTQNPELKHELLSTGDRIIVEASPLDKIWGIGMGENEPGNENPENWKGLNLLGLAIMLVRNQLRNNNV
jgi:ribA/ribD-fused uncharacterized protein